MLSDRRTHALIFLYVTVFVDALGFGITTPAVPQLVIALTGKSAGNAAAYGGVLLGSYAVMQFVFAPVLGSLSDRVGRRPVLLASLAAFGVDYLVMTFAPAYAWLLIGRMIAGACGASIVVASSYVADRTHGTDRTRTFGRLSAAYLIGFSIGPAIGGLLASANLRLPFAVSAGLALCNVIYGAIVIGESLPAEHRRPFSLARSNPIGLFIQMKLYSAIPYLLVALALYRFAYEANQSTWVYFTIEKFRWTSAEVGASIAVLTILVACAQAFLAGPISKLLTERSTLYIGMGLYAVGFIGFGLANSVIAFCMFFVPFGLGGIANPTVRSIMSREVPKDSQGALQGAIASVQSATSVVAPLGMTQVFRYFTTGGSPRYFPGAPFLLAAALMFVAGLMCFVALRTRATTRDQAATAGKP